jgi:phosphoglycerate dehydrogenase-like enzyme
LAGLLVGPEFLRDYADRVTALAREAGASIEPIALPADPAARLDRAEVLRIELAYFSGDVYPAHSGAFFAAAFSAEKLHWMHCFNAGTDHPIFARLLERGVQLTNSPGASAVPIAHSAIAGLLALARGLPLFGEAQRERRWLDTGAIAPPLDLAGQTLVVVGLGGIGGEIARLASALGMRVVGVRRSAPDALLPVDELVPPARLREVLASASWLAIACPLTDETRGWIDADALALLPDGAHVINVARGGIVDEAALISELRCGRIAGAYLDVFEVEPLPESSPLWSLPNVIVTPHAAALSAGNRARQAELFLANLRRWALGEALANVVA